MDNNTKSAWAEIALTLMANVVAPTLRFATGIVGGWLIIFCFGWILDAYLPAIDKTQIPVFAGLLNVLGLYFTKSEK